MLLTIDIGNTTIKSALFENDNLIQFTRCDNLEEMFNSKFNKEISQIAFSSVVPQGSKSLIKFYTKNKNITPFQISRNSKFNLQIEYKSIDSLGIDRICSAEGAYYLFNQSNKLSKLKENSFIITVDCGTATTINIIKSPNIFIGGMIAPGIDTMLENLNEKTAQLPIIKKEELDYNIGNDTTSSISSGVVNSAIGLIERAHKILKENYSAESIYTFLTGGNANILSNFLSIEHKVEEALVLIGVKEIFKLNNSKI